MIVVFKTEHSFHALSGVKDAHYRSEAGAEDRTLCLTFMDGSEPAEFKGAYRAAIIADGLSFPLS